MYEFFQADLEVDCIILQSFVLKHSCIENIKDLEGVNQF